MNYRILVNPGLHRSELRLGTITFHGECTWKDMGEADWATGKTITKAAFDAAFTFIDKANIYSVGQAELLVGNVRRRVGKPPNDLVVATMATCLMSNFPGGVGHSLCHRMNHVASSVRIVTLGQINGYQLHCAETRTPIEETLNTLNDPVRWGMVHQTGVCNMSACQVMKAFGIWKHGTGLGFPFYRHAAQWPASTLSAK